MLNSVCPLAFELGRGYFSQEASKQKISESCRKLHFLNCVWFFDLEIFQTSTPLQRMYKRKINENRQLMDIFINILHCCNPFEVLSSNCCDLLNKHNVPLALIVRSKGQIIFPLFKCIIIVNYPHYPRG